MNPVLDDKIRGFYGMVDVAASGTVAEAVALGRALLSGGVTALQLRYKTGSAAELFAVASELARLCRAAGALFVVNDRLDVALACGADGVHLGQDDLPLLSARQALMQCDQKLVIGISTHNLAQALEAVRGGADYLGFGPCFPTRSKLNPDDQVSLDELQAVCQLGVPVVAIGGIAPGNIRAVVAAGAAAAAAIESVNRSADIAASVRELNRAWPAISQ